MCISLFTSLVWTCGTVELGLANKNSKRGFRICCEGERERERVSVPLFISHRHAHLCSIKEKKVPPGIESIFTQRCAWDYNL